MQIAEDAVIVPKHRTRLSRPQFFGTLGAARPD
jgi:hypothetical protein